MNKNSSLERENNQRAFRKLKPMIDHRYPQGRYVAIDEGSIVADAADFDELSTALTSVGKNSKEVLVVQAGVDYPEKAVIFLKGNANGPFALTATEPLQRISVTCLGPAWNR